MHGLHWRKNKLKRVVGGGCHPLYATLEKREVVIATLRMGAKVNQNGDVWLRKINMSPKRQGGRRESCSLEQPRDVVKTDWDVPVHTIHVSDGNFLDRVP